MKSKRMSDWRVINSARVVQDTGDPCRTGIKVGNKIYPLGGAVDYLQNDETATDYIKNRPFYETTVETSIEGMTIDGFPIATSGETAHNLNVPLALGQVWSVYKNDGSLEGTYDVQEDEDGRLFVCGSPVKITADTIVCDSSWVRMLSVQRIYIVGVSGTFIETKVKTIDPKYLPASGAMIVNLSNDGSKYTADKTYNEIKAAVEAGKVVRLFDAAKYQYYDLNFMSSMMMAFCAIEYFSGQLYQKTFQVYSYTTEVTTSTHYIQMTEQ